MDPSHLSVSGVYFEAEHVYVVRIGDKTPHVHFHFVPRFPGTPRDVWQATLWQWPDGRKASADDMVAITRKFVEFSR